jgi:hypothetical protein
VGMTLDFHPMFIYGAVALCGLILLARLLLR